MVYLEGELGSGKTSLCQSIVTAAGYSGSVTSPTYNLIHEYPLPARSRVIYHLDLYRLNDPQELYYLGLQDLWNEEALFLVEWAKKGEGVLQAADYVVEVEKVVEEGDSSRKVFVKQLV